MFFVVVIVQQSTFGCENDWLAGKNENKNQRKTKKRAIIIINVVQL